MKKIVLAILLLASTAHADSISITPDMVTVPEINGCAKYGVARTDYYEQVVECDNDETFFVKLPADASMPAALTHDLFFTTPATSGSASCWKLRIAAFVNAEEYNMATGGMGAFGSPFVVSHNTTFAYSPADKTTSKTTYNVALSSNCANDNECDDAAYLELQITRVGSGCASNIPDKVLFVSDRITW